MSVRKTVNQPASPLAFFYPAEGQSPRLLLLTGPRGAGKTSWCQELSKIALSAGIDVGGLLSPAIFSDGRKVAIDLHDLVGGERRRLAVRRHDRTFRELVTGDWMFEPDTFNWGNQVLQRIKSCDLLLIDEIGPLEFHQQKGLTNAFRLISSQSYRLACLTIRPTLLVAAKTLWPEATTVDIARDSGVNPKTKKP